MRRDDLNKGVWLTMVALVTGCFIYGGCVIAQARVLGGALDEDWEIVWGSVLLVGAPVFLCFWLRWILRVNLDRGPKPGHCACGYNLTGNVSGVCPECGTQVKDQS